MQNTKLALVVRLSPYLKDNPEREAEMWAALAGASNTPEHVYAPAIRPRTDYDDSPHGSARLTLPTGVSRWDVLEVRLDGPSHANPFVDVELTATFRHGDRTLTAGGFYDGDGTYLIRVLAEEEGEWTFTTTSTASSLDGISGTIVVGPAREGARGPVRRDGFHFRYADGTRYLPIGTTCYAWTHQREELQEETLQTLAITPFTKVRMCVFPKSFLYNNESPERYPFVMNRSAIDPTRFDTSYFAHLERRIRDLAELGIEADLILFHPYDTWGFSDQGPAVDARYVTYVVRRLAAFSNVWWSLANEFDLLWQKSLPEWDAIAEVVRANDPHGHLLSIHNCMTTFDNSADWATHSSMQRIDVYRTAENVTEWRKQWGKPVIVDEVGYEGDLDLGWGNLTGREFVRRCWEGAVRGGYVAHGETYLNDEEELWWSKGGRLVGESPTRMAFLRDVIAASPTGVLEPCPSDWDVAWGGVPGEYLVGYLGFGQPRFRNVVLPEGEWRLDVLDTWDMTVTPVEGEHEGNVRVELPGKQYMAIRAVRVG